MEEKFLPVGTVVKIKQNVKEIMITGYRVIADEIEYDYCGVLHPYGVTNTKKIVFDHTDIEKISFKGYSNKDFIELNKKLKDF